jgi:hypothetical protein
MPTELPFRHASNPALARAVKKLLPFPFAGEDTPSSTPRLEVSRGVFPPISAGDHRPRLRQLRSFTAGGADLRASFRDQAPRPP